MFYSVTPMKKILTVLVLLLPVLGFSQTKEAALYREGDQMNVLAAIRLNQAMAKRFAGRDKLVMIPGNVNLDTENNFPTVKEAVNAQNPALTVRQSNGVHPAVSGYNQMGDVYYAWLKYQLAAPKTKK